MPACPTCGEETPERARFCPSCGAPLIAREPPREDLRKIVTVLFTDLKGSTSMGERLDSESLRQLMRRYFATMEAILERHGGTVEVHRRRDHGRVRRAVGTRGRRAADRPRGRRDALGARRPQRGARGALGRPAARAHRREHRRGRRGDPSRGHGFVTGDAVNVAARLEQAATEDEILIGEDTLRLVRDAVQVTAVEPLELKGKAEPVPAYRLLSVEAGAPGFSRRLDSALVGREDELGGLRAALEKVTAERSCALVSVLSAAGVGKSRLTAEFVATLGDDATVLEGRCLPYGEGITFWPVGEVLKAAAGITEEDAPEQMREKLASLVGGAEEAEPILQRMEGVLGLADAASSPVEIWAVRRLIEGLAADRPVVLVFDDVHWAESTFLDLIEYLATSSRDAPILVLVMGRTELLELRPGLAGITTDSSLEPLSGSETRSLVENLLGGGELDPAVAEHVLAAGEGNPLFVEEFLRLLVEEGRIEQRGGRWRAAGELAAASTPPTIQALIAARLDRLATGERAVIECAAVIGKSFWPSAVRELAPSERATTSRATSRRSCASSCWPPPWGRASPARRASPSATSWCATSPTRRCSRRCGPTCMRAPRPGSRRPRASAPSSTRRSSATTSSRPTATSWRSTPATSAPRTSPRARRHGSRRRAAARGALRHARRGEPAGAPPRCWPRTTPPAATSRSSSASRWPGRASSPA